MGHGQNSVEAVGGIERTNFGGDSGHEKHVAVAENHTLGKAGGAGSVDQRADVILGWLRGIDFFRLHIFVERADAERAETSDRRDDGVMPFGVLRGLGRDGGHIKDAARAAVVADFVDFAGAEFGIHQHGPGVHGGEREEDGDEGAAIFDDDHDAVAGADSEIVAEPGLRFLGRRR